ncbi:MAG: hypothetical protein ABFC88_12805 [Thermoguttaceae bacterium]
MRSISAAAKTKLRTKKGIEPITVIEVDWAPNHTLSYADRDLTSIPGRIIEVGAIDNVVTVSNSSSSQQLAVTIDDTDGIIKALFDTNDVHKRNARVYQYFQGLDLADKFLLFAGKVSSPITWNERDRTVKFTIISQLEDREVGFSAEEGQFPYLPADLVGKPWPSIFGVVQDCPALQVNHAVQGTTLTGVGVVAGQAYYAGFPLYNTGSNQDSNLGAGLANISAQINVLFCAEACANFADDGAKAQQYLDQINQLEAQRTEMVAQAASKQACAQWQRAQQLADANSKGAGANPIQVLGGEDFPQNTPLTIDINGAEFTGYFNGQNFYVSGRYCQSIADQAAQANSEQTSSCPYEHRSGGGNNEYDYKIDVSCDCMWADFDTCWCRQHGFIISTSNDSANTKSDNPILQQFWADAGATVKIKSDEPITYIVSIVPGSVLAVKAYKQFTGERRLVLVPNNLYTVRSHNYGAVTAVELVFAKPLSSYTDQGWSDDVYVTFQSSVGPDTINVLKYLITNYTGLTWDNASFNNVQSKLAPFPVNFPLLDRKNTLQLLQEIAFQSRCALWLSNGVFYIQYLPEEPTPDPTDGTITVSDLDADAGVEVELTPTEDLVTKMTVKWRVSWAPGATDRDKDKSEKTMILRHNVTRYGTQEQEYDWYIYNQPDIIYKAATFWLIRKSSTWKKIKFKTFLHKLGLETFDAVNLNFAGGYVANGAVKAIVEQANYDSSDNTVEVQCIVPVRSGEMSKYVYYWPAALPASVTWPPADDVAKNDAGGGGIGMNATGNLPVGDTSAIDAGGIVWVGGPNVVFHARSDWGDRHPTDIGFSAQRVVNPSFYAELNPTSKPYLNLRTFTVAPMQPYIPQQMGNQITLDIARTKVVDSNARDGRTARLNSLIARIDEDNNLVIKGDARIGDSSGTQCGQLDDVIFVSSTGIACLREDVSVASEAHDTSEAWLSDALVVSDETGCLSLDASVYIANGDGEESQFDFKYDADGGVYGAGTAFLQD